MPMATRADLYLETHSYLGEGALWDPTRSGWWWIDIREGLLHFCHVRSGANSTYELGEMIGTVVVREAGGVVVALEHGLAAYDLESRTLTRICDPESDLVGNRFNDGKCDPAGRFWAGTMDKNEEQASGSLYCLDTTGKCSRKLSDVAISNGIVWTGNRETMYYIDSPTRRVDRFDFDVESGEISNRRQAFGIPDGMGFPDGMTIDSNDTLWVALWAGSCVAQFDPSSGELLHKVELPVGHVTSCSFGGDSLDELFITTARHKLTNSQLDDQPLAGCVFKARVPAQGVHAWTYGG